MNKTCKTIKYKLTSGEVVLIDEENWELMEEYEWSIDEDGYVSYHRNRKFIFLHRLIYPSSVGTVDHKNRNKLDNRKENLRIATASESSQNTGRMSKLTGYRGVYPKGNNYRAMISLNGKLFYIRSYSNRETAAIVYDIGATILYDNPINFPGKKEKYDQSLYEEVYKILKKKGALKAKREHDSNKAKGIYIIPSVEPNPNKGANHSRNKAGDKHRARVKKNGKDMYSNSIRLTPCS